MSKNNCRFSTFLINVTITIATIYTENIWMCPHMFCLASTEFILQHKFWNGNCPYPFIWKIVLIIKMTLLYIISLLISKL